MHIRISMLIILSSLTVVGCGGRSTNDLISDLNSSSDENRIKAVRLLQHRSGDASTVVPALITSLRDSQADIRWSAVIGLGYFGAQASSALPELEKALNDKDARVRNAAKVAISRIKGP